MQFLQTIGTLISPTGFIFLMALVGLLVGSFLNVVIHRLPIMLEKQWQRDCDCYFNAENNSPIETLNLAFPNSRCPRCRTPIAVKHNIPVLSYLWLRGKCATCNETISVRYPLVELFTSILSAIIAWHFGIGLPAFAALLLTWALIALSFIDIEHLLLPDSIVYPMLWLGLILSLFDVFTDSHSSIIGAASGYLSLWTIYHGFKLTIGKEGMGYGDFKLLAMLGAWVGWQYLALIILLSSLVGTTIGLTLISLNKQKSDTPIPFGPYLAIAGWIALLWGNKLNAWYFG